MRFPAVQKFSKIG